jgi:heptosyltransferase-2
MKTDSLPSRIVVRGTNWVGDTVMSLPAAKELRRIFPFTNLTFWVPAGLASLVRATGIPDDIITFGADAGGPFRRPFHMRKVLASGAFHMAVLFQNAFEGAFTAWLAGVPLRVGYPTDLRGPFLNMPVLLTPQIRQKHQVFYYLAITEHLETVFRGEARSEPITPNCSIPLDAVSLERARNLLSSTGIAGVGPVFSLCPGSVNSEAKRWPPEYFSCLGDQLIERMDARIVFLGAPDERDLIDGIILGMRSRRKAVSFAGRADMVTSMAIMSMSRVVISNDTGSAHLAVAAGAKVLTIFGPTSPGATAPYGPGVHVIHGEASCSPCKHFRCPRPDHQCMRSLRPEAVFRQVEWILLPQSRSKAR